MSRSTNRYKHYQLKKKAKANRLTHTKNKISGDGSRRKSKKISSISSALGTLDSGKSVSISYRSNTPPRKSIPKRRSAQLSRRRRTATKRKAGVMSIRNAFKTMGINVNINVGNYKHYFKLLSDAKLTSGKALYAATLRLAYTKTEDLGRFEGRLYDLITDDVNYLYELQNNTDEVQRQLAKANRESRKRYNEDVDTLWVDKRKNR